MIGNYLVSLAEKYETIDFLNEDPSQFMHLFKEPKDQEKAAFIAAALSYGSRKQFLQKIKILMPLVANKNIRIEDIVSDDSNSFYRLHTNHDIVQFVHVVEDIEKKYGSLGEWLRENDVHTGIEAVELITSFFSLHGASALIPKNAKSSCKRICMFLRWMVRDNSPVDLGIWNSQIDKRSLIIPMDTHVIQEATKLGLLKSKTASMSTAIALTENLKKYFPDDPLKADFALFGVGVDKNE